MAQEHADLDQLHAFSNQQTCGAVPQVVEPDPGQPGYNLGFRYDLGLGVPQDDAEAVRWYRRAAERGHEVAQYNLGNKYDNGTGVAQNYAEAARWYRLAAEQGHPSKQRFGIVD